MFDTSTLAGFQRDFLQAITAANPPQHPALRMHHDTWLFGLIDALAEVYPATQKLLGDEAFKAFARDYIRAHPLTKGDVTTYGGDFADFLAGHAQLGDLSWLPDLARYEHALHRAHHADDATGCSFEVLLDPAARTGLHPSATVLQLGHDIQAAHAAALLSEPLPRIRPVACAILVARDPHDATVQLCLAPLEAQFITLVAQEASLMTALDQLDPSADDMTLLQSLLAGLVQHGLLITR